MTTTNFIDGVTNAASTTGVMGTYVSMDPTRLHQWWNDFDSFEATQLITITDPGNTTVYRDWLVTQVTGTTATALVTDEDGGVVVMTNDSTAAHGVYAQWQGGSTSVAETFTFNSAKAMWMKARFKLSSATNTAMVLGLIVTDTTPQANTDGLYFIKADASTSLKFNATASSTTTQVTVGTLADNTYVEVGFAYLPNGDGNTANGAPAGLLYLNGVYVGKFSTFANFPTTELAVTFGVSNGAAGASTTMSTDYILVAKER